jgi:hypothetical protein
MQSPSAGQHEPKQEQQIPAPVDKPKHSSMVVGGHFKSKNMAVIMWW